jgi:hypothetical protein
MSMTPTTPFPIPVAANQNNPTAARRTPMLPQDFLSTRLANTSTLRAANSDLPAHHPGGSST